MSRFIDQLMLVNNILPWEHASHDEPGVGLGRVAQDVAMHLNDDIERIFIPVTSQDPIGPMAFYLARKLNGLGIDTIVPKTPWAKTVERVIEESRVDVTAPARVIPTFVNAAEYLEDRSVSRLRRLKLGKNALVIVTSEPFVYGAMDYQQEYMHVPLVERSARVAQGAVYSVDLKAFGIDTSATS